MKRNLLAAAVPALTHLGLLQVKRNLVGAFVPLLQHLGLLIAFVLLIAGHEFATKHPVLATVLVFVFSLPYLIVSVTTRRASFLYATMLLGAVSYFLACHALGAFVSTAVLLFVGTRFHRQKEYGWSRHFYFSAAGTMLYRWRSRLCGGLLSWLIWL